MKSRTAFWPGVVGGAMMSAILLAGRMLGMEGPNLELMTGSLVTGTISMTAWLTGYVIHLAVSGGIACIYSRAFEKITEEAGAALGIAFSVPHLVISGILLGFLPWIHPLMGGSPQMITPGTMGAPGFFAVNYGATGSFAFILVHLVYGAFVGSVHPPLPAAKAEETELRYEEMRHAA